MATRVLILEAGSAHDVLEVLAVSDTLIRARATYRFEIGEELQLRIEPDGAAAREVTARVRSHGLELELELGE